MTLDGCAQCSDFRRIEIDVESKPVVCCDSARTRDVVDVLFVPPACASPDTPALALLPYLDLDAPWNIVPIIERDASSVGVIDCALLRRELAAGLDLNTPLRAIMSTALANFGPKTRLCDAAARRPDAGFRGVLVVSPIGTLVGVVSENELEH